MTYKMLVAITSKISLAFLLAGCSASSNTTCSNPDAADPACVLDSRRTPVFEGASAESEIPQCTAAREGNVYYVKSTGTFKVCSDGENKDVSVAGPPGAPGPAGEAGADGSEGSADLSTSGLIAPGASLTLTHNLNTMTPPAYAFFARKGLLRPVSQYRNEVGRRSITVTGTNWDGNFRPQVVSLNNGNMAVIHGDWPEQAVRRTVLDIYSDEGELIKQNAKIFSPLITVRAIAVSNGLLIIYEENGLPDEYFTVIANDGTTLIPPTVFAISPGNNRIKDLKKLSDGNVIVAEQVGSSAAFHILNPLNGTVVASNTNAAASSDYRTLTVPLDGKFMLFYTDIALTPHTRVAVFNNDGSLNGAPASAGLGDETILGAERIAADRIAIVTSSFNNLSSTLFDTTLNTIRGPAKYSSLSADGASPVSIGNGNWIVCSTRSEGYCVAFDREGREIYRNSDLFPTSSSADFSAIVALGNEGRFALATQDATADSSLVYLLQTSAGRLDLEVVDANSVRIVNRSVEALSIVLGINR